MAVNLGDKNCQKKFLASVMSGLFSAVSMRPILAESCLTAMTSSNTAMMPLPTGAAAKCEEPFTAMLCKGVDGYQTNAHLKLLETPERLKDKVAAYIVEINEVSMDAAAEKDRQGSEWRP